MSSSGKRHYEEFMAAVRPETDRVWFGSALQLLKGQTDLSNVLEIGSGTTGFAKLMRDSLALKVHCIDIAETNVRRAREEGFFAERCDLERDIIPLESGSMDAVTCLETIEHIFDTDHVLEEIHRVLRRDGVLVISTPNPMYAAHRIRYLLKGIPPWKEGHHIRFFTPARLRHYLQLNSFEIEAQAHYNRWMGRRVPERLAGLLAWDVCYRARKEDVPVIGVSEHLWDHLQELDGDSKRAVAVRLQGLVNAGDLDRGTRQRILGVMSAQESHTSDSG